MTVKREQRAKAFAAIREIRARRGPSLFNPHYEIKPTPVKDSSVSSKTGPRMLTQQWEPTGRRSTK